MTLILIALNLLGFALESAGDRETVMRFALWPPHAGGAAGFHLWQLVTYSFLHASATHLAFNMWGLYMFGRPIERALGARRMGELYVASVVTGALAQTAVALLSAAGAYPSVGASAGVFGVLLAYALLFPKEPVVLLFPPIPMPAWLFATGYALLELALGLTGRAPGIAHFAHLGGMAAALALVLHWTRRAQHGQLD
ncbi:rhomboid family intramembrane serine protease [Paraburkholderia rhizosphaerae]|nr:rhomboid family intramembrane serine protease [Paraburkholderia rhizosphaerae]